MGPDVTERRRRNWQVELALWARQRGDRQGRALHWLITRWWGVRNGFRWHVWWPLCGLAGKPWFWLRARIWGCWLHPKPWPYSGIPFVFRYCVRCMFDETVRKARVSALQPPPAGPTS